MPAAASQKICVLCGVDLASTKRIKDRKGRYYCRACYHEARLKIAEQRRAAACDETANDETAIDETAIGQALNESRAGETPGETHSETFIASTAADEDLSELLDTFDDSSASQSATGFPASTDPGDEALSATGYSSSGKPKEPPDTPDTPDTTAKKPPILTPQIKADLSLVDALQQSGWHVWFAVTSIFFGGSGLLLNGLAAAGIVGSGISAGDSRFIAAGAGAGLIAIGMSWWLLRAGLGILTRHVQSIESITNWAIIKIAIAGLSGIAIIACCLLEVIDLHWFTQQTQMHRLNPLLGSVIATTVLFYLWQFFWPVFTLIWLNRSAVRRDVNAWG